MTPSPDALGLIVVLLFLLLAVLGQEDPPRPVR